MSTIPESAGICGIVSGILNKGTFHQFKRYVITGLASFTLEYLLFFILYRRVGLWYISANAVVYVTIFWFNFLMNRYWSFKSGGSLRRQLMLYCILFVFNLGAITVLMYLLSDVAGITPMISKIAVMGAVVLWNFVLYKKVIYK
jgi:putative flippase GtrA